MIYVACGKTLTKAADRYNRLSTRRISAIYALCALLITAIMLLVGTLREQDNLTTTLAVCALEYDNLHAQYGLCNDKLNVCAAQITDWREHQLCFNTPPTIIGVDSVVIR